MSRGGGWLNDQLTFPPQETFLKILTENLLEILSDLENI